MLDKLLTPDEYNNLALEYKEQFGNLFKICPNPRYSDDMQTTEPTPLENIVCGMTYKGRSIMKYKILLTWMHSNLLDKGVVPKDKEELVDYCLSYCMACLGIETALYTCFDPAPNRSWIFSPKKARYSTSFLAPSPEKGLTVWRGWELFANSDETQSIGITIYLTADRVSLNSWRDSLVLIKANSIWTAEKTYIKKLGEFKETIEEILTTNYYSFDSDKHEWRRPDPAELDKKKLSSGTSGSVWGVSIGGKPIDLEAGSVYMTDDGKMFETKEEMEEYIRRRDELSKKISEIEAEIDPEALKDILSKGYHIAISPSDTISKKGIEKR